MAVKLEFCNIIVPVAKIREKLGDEVFEKEYSQPTETSWNDGLLWRYGCMGDSVLSGILDDWESRGF